MRVLHVIPSISPLNGGPSVALLALAGALVGRGGEVDVATTDDHGDVHLEVPFGKPVVRDGVRYFFFRRQSKFYTVSGGLAAWLIRHVTQYDLVHIHGLFSFPSVFTAMVAKLSGIPYVVQPHGTLGRWGFAQRHPYMKRSSLNQWAFYATQGDPFHIWGCFTLSEHGSGAKGSQGNWHHAISRCRPLCNDSSTLRSNRFRRAIFASIPSIPIQKDPHRPWHIIHLHTL